MHKKTLNFCINFWCKVHSHRYFNCQYIWISDFLIFQLEYKWKFYHMLYYVLNEQLQCTWKTDQTTIGMITQCGTSCVHEKELTHKAIYNESEWFWISKLLIYLSFCVCVSDIRSFWLGDDWKCLLLLILMCWFIVLEY